MHFPMKIQPVDADSVQPPPHPIGRADAGKPVLKSRLKRLFDRQFNNVLKIAPTAERVSSEVKDEVFEPSSVCLDKMVQNFIEEANDKQSAVKCGRNRCNCFNGNNNDSSDDEFDHRDSLSYADPADFLKSLIPCATVVERNLLADTAKIVEKNKIVKRKDDLILVVRDGLRALGYDASICKSRWEKTPSLPAGTYEYLDAIVDGERVIIDVDFRSEFEIARSTRSYQNTLQLIPFIFVGKPDRLQQILSIVSEAARQSLKKKGMHFPPWRKAEYMRAKWLSQHTRDTPSDEVVAGGNNKYSEEKTNNTANDNDKNNNKVNNEIEIECGELELIFGTEDEEEESPEEPPVTSTAWSLPAIKPRSLEKGGGKAVVTGLASLLNEKP